MKLGGENKNSVRALAVLGLVLAGAIYYSFFSDSTPSAPATARVAAPAPGENASSEEASAPRSARGRTDEFLPVLHKKHADKAEPVPQDPTLRLDLLAKLDEVPPAGSGRDLFNFGKPAPEKLAGAEPKIPVYQPVGPPHLTPNGPKLAAAAPAPPPPPPINLKYYGICTTRADGQKTAFFMDGDDILIEAEGATFKGRYRLLRIGVNSAVVEDLQYKHEQTLPLAEEAQGQGAGD
jgi:hypothetical protein